MSEYTVRKCDECGAVHGTVNNWWCIVADPSRPTFIKFEETEAMLKTGRLPDNTSRLDYCSHSCIVTAFNRWLDTGSVVKQEENVHAATVS